MSIKIQCNEEINFMPDGTALTYRSWYNPLWYTESYMPRDNRTCFLLLHNLLSGFSIWDNIAPELVRVSDTFTFSLDNVTPKLSEVPQEVSDIKRFADYVYEFGDYQEFYSVHPLVVGYGWGAIIGLVYAATHPELVEGLVLLDDDLNNFTDSSHELKQLVQELAPMVRSQILIVTNNTELSQAGKQISEWFKWSVGNQLTLTCTSDTLVNTLVQNPSELAHIIVNHFI